ncbi:YXWGXW repeat protein [Burkholderia lata]|uniref:YXWGXW repeat-containing protein n=1 Tax=Burkholderia lata (strain ATCC 17760 / DSM 23089 / LMG 22485 / NCIMB 9086 / R18194 / 383) TaxID=482957 RepID=UPI001453EB48|nr:YXWGXW repeat-containing protein [Burkholderia lata]VWC22074.1 YXWGXW repeat protein [Burkholderia lata]
MAVSTVQRRIVSLALFAAGLSAVVAPFAAHADEILVGTPVIVPQGRVVIAEPVAVRTEEIVVVAPNAPPPVRYEVVPASRMGYVWDRGHWHWEHGRYVWIGGHWETERVGMQWVPGHWDQRGPNWFWTRGHWA